MLFSGFFGIFDRLGGFIWDFFDLISLGDGVLHFLVLAFFNFIIIIFFLG